MFGDRTLDISQLDVSGLTIGSLEGDGMVLLGNHKLNIGRSNLSTTFAGVLQGTGSVIKLGAGTLTLSGENLYTGGTTVSQGTLVVSNTTRLRYWNRLGGG